MRLATLITNTDDSDFARARPDDGAKFAAMIKAVRPDWTCTPVWVCKGEFPPDIAAFDGVMITGSPSSVHADLPWIAPLKALVQRIIERGQPLFGTCFGHQLIASALGAPIVRNPQGWGHGRLEITRSEATPWAGDQEQLSLYGSHIEQVGALPKGAKTVLTAPGCPIAGFAIGNDVFTVQHHPEMDHTFITDLVDHYADEVGPEVTEAARASLASPADSIAFAEEIARFFEQAVAAKAGG
ncbi:Glutamine amidotransferase, class I [Sulfitobacter noctilucae]|uniref:type 1 glutamine amidotransferase n=1 Tax=Sulfitobacter noctilucae TaxID=1342302 RepID=UPI00046A5689|nr:type 1 glutamine amidotransferase [Sulfitobacter noctilucae]KIN70454.1 Glutamine amidotransferase, class I [Sulfitobacter noctilucae]